MLQEIEKKKKQKPFITKKLYLSINLFFYDISLYSCHKKLTLIKRIALDTRPVSEEIRKPVPDLQID